PYVRLTDEINRALTRTFIFCGDSFAPKNLWIKLFRGFIWPLSRFNSLMLRFNSLFSDFRLFIESSVFLILDPDNSLDIPIIISLSLIN
ncbi:MAG: hypothetical protein ACRCZ4_13190, partial [Plesiomonas sp.]|uniref:hypothetical protein n=1 Tax=Plesiomonas sp. TaxID=2486279 RepID=UPI003F2A9646